MVNEIIKYLNSIGEVNLSAQKVELGAVQEVEKASKDLVRFIETTLTRVGSLRTEITEKSIKFEKDRLSALAKFEQLSKSFRVAEASLISTAKDLGVNYQEIPAYKKARQVENYVINVAKEDSLKKL